MEGCRVFGRKGEVARINKSPNNIQSKMFETLCDSVASIRDAADALTMIEDAIVALELVAGLLETEAYSSMDATKASKISACLSLIDLVRASLENHADQCKMHLKHATQLLEAWQPE